VNICVVPDGGGWSVKRGAESLAPIATHRSQEDAISSARVLARAEGVPLQIAVICEHPGCHALATDTMDTTTTTDRITWQVRFTCAAGHEFEKEFILYTDAAER
jgi:hypothetical protein